jgi:DnaJ domain.
VDVTRQDLRDRLARRQQEKAELERQRHAVRRRLQDEVAPLKEQVLRLRMEQLRRAAQRHMRSAKHRNAYHDAQRAYETYRAERPRDDAPVVEDLKGQYRRATKRCHPDVVPAAYREQAAATFQALEAAYQAGHGRAVRAIAEALERWGFPTPSADDDPDDGRARAELQEAVSALEAAINTIRSTEAYQAVVDVDDVDAALRLKKEQLRRLLEQLKQA